MKKIVKGNDFTLKIPVMKYVDGKLAAYPLPGCTDIEVALVSKLDKQYALPFTIGTEDDHVIHASVESGNMPTGSYSLLVKGKKYGAAWRSKEYEQVCLVDNNEQGDTVFAPGDTSEGEDSVEMDTAIVVLPATVELETLISDARKTVSDARKAISDVQRSVDDINTSIQEAEEKRAETEADRAKAEATRVEAEKERTKQEGIRQESETERIRQETERQNGETARNNSESDRMKKYAALEAALAKTKADLETTLAETKTECESAAKKASDAASGAERCNVTLQGSTITVTDREGNQKSVDVVDTDETANLTIASSVESVKVGGIKVNVYINNGKTPAQYTTDGEGKVTFTVKRGEYYEIKFPEYANAQPISPVGFTATLPSRDISAEYVPYDEESSEKVVVKVTKYTDGKGAAWQGKEVKCTYDGKTTSYTTDATGQATIYVPFGKKYTVQVDDEDGYFVRFGNNSRTWTADVTQRILVFNLYQFQTGLYCVDKGGQEYTIDEWMATGRDGEEVVAIKFADQNLMLHHGTFMYRTSDLRNIDNLSKAQWCTQNLLFESIPERGNNQSEAYYWDGKGASQLVREEAQSRGLSVPAFEAAYSATFMLNDEELYGFLPSVGQEYVHMSNSEAVREIMRKLYGDQAAATYYQKVRNTYRWTSTQSGSSNAYIYSSSLTNDYKTDSTRTLPAYAC